MVQFELHSRNLAQEQVAHTHDFHQLILATCGVTELSMEGQGERVTARRGCLIPSSRQHEYQGDGSNRTLVRHSAMSLGHIAMLVGFRDQGSFSRAYRRYFDISPSSDR